MSICPDCIQFNVYAGAGNFDYFVACDSIMYVGYTNSGCNASGINAPLFGLQCDTETPGDCEDCNTFMSQTCTGWVIFEPLAHDAYLVGYESNSCTDISGPETIFYGIDCDPGVDCTDCIQLNVLLDDGSGFQPYSASNGLLSISSVGGSCIPIVYDYVFDMNIEIFKDGNLASLVDTEYEYSINGGEYTVLQPSTVNDVAVLTSDSVHIRTANNITSIRFLGNSDERKVIYSGVINTATTLVDISTLFTFQDNLDNFAIPAENNILNASQISYGCTNLKSVGQLRLSYCLDFYFAFAFCPELLCLTEINTVACVSNNPTKTDDMFNGVTALADPSVAQQDVILAGDNWETTGNCNSVNPSDPLQDFAVNVLSSSEYDTLTVEDGTGGTEILRVLV